MGCHHDGDGPQRSGNDDECEFDHLRRIAHARCSEDVTPCRETACLRDHIRAVRRRLRTRPKPRLRPYRTSPQRNARPDDLRSGIPETVPCSITRRPEALTASRDGTGMPPTIVRRRHRRTGLSGSMPLAPQAGKGRASQTAVPARTRANSKKGAASNRPIRCDQRGMRVITKPFHSSYRPRSYLHGIARADSRLRHPRLANRTRPGLEQATRCRTGRRMPPLKERSVCPCRRSHRRRNRSIPCVLHSSSPASA